MTLDEMLASYAQTNGMPGGDVMSDADPIAGDQFAEAKKKGSQQKAGPAPQPKAPALAIPEIKISPLATPEEAAELNRLNEQIARGRAEVARITGVDSDIQGTNAKRIAAGPINESIAKMEERFNALNDTINQRRVAQREVQAKAESPFRNEHSDIYRELPHVGWGASVGMGGVTGLLAGLAGKRLPGVMAAGGAMGALDSLLAATYPTVSDSSTLPPGSPYQTEAAGWLYGRDPKANYWQDRVLPEVAMGTGLGSVSAGVGTKFGQALRMTGQGIANLYRGARSMLRGGEAAAPSVMEEIPAMRQADSLEMPMPARAPDVAPAVPEMPAAAAATEAPEAGAVAQKLEEMAPKPGTMAKPPRKSAPRGKKKKDTYH
jgi:hypothetical protein